MNDLSEDDAVIALVPSRIAEGASQEDILRVFRERGLSWLRSVRALHLATGVSIGEAKRAVTFSETWADELPAREALERELDAAIDAGVLKSE